MADLVGNANRFMDDEGEAPRRTNRRYLEGAVSTFAYRTIEELNGFLDALDQNQEAVEDSLGIEMSQTLRKDVDMLIQKLRDTTRRMSNRRRRKYN